jgi:PPE-repeat protein
MDYGALPPEVNSARMYSGPGAGSMIAAAAAWDELAAELYLAATGYGSVTSGLSGAWTGPAAASMAAAAQPYITWLSTTAGQAEQAANQARAAVGAYESAFAATVPPPEIAANRARLMMLVATNLLGQNSPAIAATEARYEQMWAQDAAVMYGYAGHSAAASTVTPFSQPPATTDPAGLARQSVATLQATGASAGTQAQEMLSQGSQLISNTPLALQGLGAPMMAGTSGTSASTSTSGSTHTALSSLTTAMSKLNVLTGPAKFAMYPMNFLQKGMTMSKVAAAPLKAMESGLAHGVAAGTGTLGTGMGAHLPGLGGGSAAFSAGMGHGIRVGALSAPQGWLTAPATNPVTAAAPSAGWTAPWADAPVSAHSGFGPAGVPMMPMAHLAGRGFGGPATSRFELRGTVVPRSPAAG